MSRERELLLSIRVAAWERQTTWVEEMVTQGLAAIDEADRRRTTLLLTFSDLVEQGLVATGMPRARSTAQHVTGYAAMLLMDLLEGTWAPPDEATLAAIAERVQSTPE